MSSAPDARHVVVAFQRACEALRLQTSVLFVKRGGERDCALDVDRL